jgi:biopolymer transport protein ExbD/biopolymer transport protein TolR
MRKPEAPEIVSEINVTPMVDVMLVLLIIFMVITPLLTKGVTVDLVKAKNPIAMKDADKEDAILISIPRNGEIFLSPGNVRPR